MTSEAQKSLSIPAKNHRADDLQRQAARPDYSIWVGASAGTGKTKVLTDRVLRLLLPFAEGVSGTPPHRILCITFTKAAASEMALRITKILSEWATFEDETLRKSLEKLLGRDPRDDEVSAARRLFAEVIESGRGLQIMTIHSFCQSVLGRFPVEASIPPNFEVVEEGEAASLLDTARKSALTQLMRAHDDPAALCLKRLSEILSEDQLGQMVKEGQKEIHQVREIMRQYGSAEKLYETICDLLEIEPRKGRIDILADHLRDGPFDSAAMAKLARGLQEGGKKDQGRAETIRRFIDSPLNERIDMFEDYFTKFLRKTDRKPSEEPASKAAVSFDPGIVGLIEKEQDRLLALDDMLIRAEGARATYDLFAVLSIILERYEQLKINRGVLDFDDLILKTAALLTGQDKGIPDDLRDRMPGWVHYKLDEGLDHILIDEAQDTNPQQWSIIQALSEDFFAGQSARNDRPRTLFTVGDSKQSIYSFQRASPKEFARMQDYFAQKIQNAKQYWDEVDLDISFRTAQTVLDMVDRVFDEKIMPAGMGSKPARHESARKGAAGRVELWPAIEDEENGNTEEDFWAPPVKINDQITPQARLAEQIATEIDRLLRRQVPLHSRDRPIKPGDIMILVRTRGTLAGHITKALKSKQVPVSGQDRIILNEDIAIQDMLALAAFALCPGDDLSLACVLKSPLIGLTEDALFDYCHNRKGAVWDEIECHGPAELRDYLSDIRSFAASMGPYGFFSTILSSPCPASEKSGLIAMGGRLGQDCFEPLEELLSRALQFENKEGPSLVKFLHNQNADDREIKREMESESNTVRLMTVHGSKGLQAPIVILPDTFITEISSSNQSDAKLFWPEKTDLDVPLWAPSKEFQFKLYKEVREQITARQEEEYRRLLYVAMTRAEDWLVVAGAKTKKQPNPISWYNCVEAAIRTMDGVTESDDGRLIFEDKRPGVADRAEKQDKIQDGSEDIPDWYYAAPPKEPSPPRPMVPSRPSHNEPAALSPLKAGTGQRFLRGNIIHKLLEILPDIAPDKRRKTGERFVKHYGRDLGEEESTQCLNETLTILENPDFAPFFAEGSRAEVPLTGLIDDHTLISGQIDRLVLNDKGVWILDFKTNRPVPDNPESVPEIYMQQLRSYKRAISVIYPDIPVHTGLLWTDGPSLMLLDV